jgi:hypothetical protein
VTDEERTELNRLRWIETNARALVFHLREDAAETRGGLSELGLTPAGEYADGVDTAARSLEDLLFAAPPPEPPLDRTTLALLQSSLQAASATVEWMLAAPGNITLSGGSDNCGNC